MHLSYRFVIKSFYIIHFSLCSSFSFRFILMKLLILYSWSFNINHRERGARSGGKGSGITRAVIRQLGEAERKRTYLSLSSPPYSIFPLWYSNKSPTNRIFAIIYMYIHIYIQYIYFYLFPSREKNATKQYIYIGMSNASQYSIYLYTRQYFDPS